jgi:hypothetical protein
LASLRSCALGTYRPDRVPQVPFGSCASRPTPARSSRVAPGGLCRYTPIWSARLPRVRTAWTGRVGPRCAAVLQAAPRAEPQPVVPRAGCEGTGARRCLGGARTGRDRSTHKPEPRPEARVQSSPSIGITGRLQSEPVVAITRCAQLAPALTHRGQHPGCHPWARAEVHRRELRTRGRRRTPVGHP